MTNKLVVIINSLEVPEIKKILLYEMKFLVPNYSCLQNPWLGGYRLQSPVLSVPCLQLNLLNPPPFPTKYFVTSLSSINNKILNVIKEWVTKENGRDDRRQKSRKYKGIKKTERRGENVKEGNLQRNYVIVFKVPVCTSPMGRGFRA